MAGGVGEAKARCEATSSPEESIPATTSIGAWGGELSMTRVTAGSDHYFAGAGVAVKVPEAENGFTSIVPLISLADSSLPE